MTARRLWSILALMLGVETALLAVLVALTRFPAGVSVLICLVLGVGAAWEGACRRGAGRILALSAAALLIAAAIAIELIEEHLLQDVLPRAGRGTSAPPRSPTGISRVGSSMSTTRLALPG